MDHNGAYAEPSVIGATVYDQTKLLYYTNQHCAYLPLPNFPQNFQYFTIKNSYILFCFTYNVTLGLSYWKELCLTSKMFKS